MWEAVPWQVIWDWGSKLGLGGAAFWLIQRWFGARDKAVDRGRSRIEDARPEVIPTTGVFLGDGRGQFTLTNRGRGTAQDINVTFTGSTALGRVPELGPGQRRDTSEMRMGDSPFFRERLTEDAELTVRYRDRFGNDYVVRLPIAQDQRDGRFNILPRWGGHRIGEPSLTKNRLREIGGR